MPLSACLKVANRGKVDQSSPCMAIPTFPQVPLKLLHSFPTIFTFALPQHLCGLECQPAMRRLESPFLRPQDAGAPRCCGKRTERLLWICTDSILHCPLCQIVKRRVLQSASSSSAASTSVTGSRASLLWIHCKNNNLRLIGWSSDAIECMPEGCKLRQS